MIQVLKSGELVRLQVPTQVPTTSKVSALLFLMFPRVNAALMCDCCKGSSYKH